MRKPQVYKIVIRKADLSEADQTMLAVCGPTHLKLMALSMVGMAPKYMSRITRFRGRPERGFWQFEIVRP